MIILRTFPLLALVVIAYNVLIVLNQTALTAVAGEVRLPSGAVWNVTAGDILIISGLALLFVEMVTATSRASSVVNHGLSLVVFLVCAFEFLLVPACGVPEFLYITLMTLIDVVAGYSISIATARRDLALEH
jgi:hypothetical protein